MALVKPINDQKWLPIQVNQATSRPPGKGLRRQKGVKMFIKPY